EINRAIPLSSNLVEWQPDTGVEPDGKQFNFKFTAGATLDLETRLAVVNRRVIEGEERVRKVRAAIERTRGLGLNIELAERLLDTMLVTLSLLMERKAALEADLRRWNMLEVHSDRRRCRKPILTPLL